MPITAYKEGNTLLKRIAKGDRDAFAQFYTSHVKSLYKYIYLFTRSKEETEEMLQDIFMKIWDRREKITELESAKNYLRQVARNKIIDKVRSHQIKHRVMAEIRRSKDVFDFATDDECAFREYYKFVQQAIDKLPPKRKLIFRLNIENGLSKAEIAQQLKISSSVVEKQIYGATHFVRKYLFEHGEISLFLLIAFLLF